MIMKTKRLPAKRNKALTQQKIYTAALELFTCCEYEDVSTKKIAELAGVNSALIFNYFGTKSGLFCHVFKVTSQDMSELLINAPYKETVAEDLKEFVSISIKLLIQSRQFMRTMFFLRNYKNIIEMDGEYTARTAILQTRLEHFRTTGKLKHDTNTHQLALSLLHIIDGTISTFSIYSDETAEYTLDKINTVLDAVAQGIAI